MHREAKVGQLVLGAISKLSDEGQPGSKEIGMIPECHVNQCKPAKLMRVDIAVEQKKSEFGGVEFVEFAEFAIHSNRGSDMSRTR